jgi:type IV fimbrial biogenesis protein FimT
MNRTDGFTLIELMVTLALAVILLALAVPSFRNTVQNNRATTTANELLTALSTARSEAIKRNETISLCSSANGTSCASSTNWATGWIMLDGSGSVLRVWSAPDGSPTITGPSASVQFDVTGAANAGTTYQVQFPECTGDQKRTITLLPTGVADVSTSTCS